MTADKQYLIGIDLGTTNCTMSCVAKGTEEIETLPILQLTTPGTEGEISCLPSFLYFPLAEERSAGALDLSWAANHHYCLGMLARDRGAEVPNRVIASAKSWLCHSGIDRREKTLPAGSDDPKCKMSPVSACAAFLEHLREVWDHSNPSAPFVDQQILITVPASFDPSARQLVQEAAENAGYPDILLLEEPQAAFYAWLQRHQQSWRNDLKVDDTVLVVDIGGGTTDFSLIRVEEDNGQLTLYRQAVGAHLLLGGDNLDLALAYVVKGKLEEQGHELDHWQMQSLVHSCRAAKEAFLGDDAPDSLDITVRGRGSRLVGGTLLAPLTYEEVSKVILDGFFPLTAPEERSKNERRLGIQQIGLPYAQDPRISCQLAKFLSMTGESDNDNMADFVMPTAVLFNGGTLKASALRQRLLDLLQNWAKKLKCDPVKLLDGADYDFGVSRGAAYYGLARAGKAIRIRGGTSRSYYIGVEDAVPAVPGVPTPLKAVCIVPFGMEEGTEQTLQGQEFALVLGETSTFRFFSRATPTLSDERAAEMGTEVRSWKQELTELHPIETLLDQSSTDGRTVRVTLRSKVTELGILELWCITADGRQWKLEFDLRNPSEVIQ